MTVTQLSRRHGYQPRGAQLRLMSTDDPQVLLSGPAGTGKSRACLEKVHDHALMWPGFKGLIVRKTAESLTNTALETFRKFVIPEAVALGEVHWYGGSRQEPAQYRYKNGSTINVGGMDKSTRIMSSEYDLIYVQEATELDEEDWENLTTRLRNGVDVVQQLIADCNPQAPQHWLKVRCDQNKTLMLNTSHEENPIFFDDLGRITQRGHAYINTLDNLTGVRYQRLRKGNWVAAEGIVFEDWNPAVHLVDPFPIPDGWRTWWAIDFGYTNPFVWQCWREDPDGNLYLEKEIYRTQTLVTDHCKEIMRLSATVRDGQQVVRRPEAIITDHDAEDRATLERAVGWSTRAAQKTVLDGIEAVQLRIKRKRIFILKDACQRRDQSLIDGKKPTCTAEEIPGYIWYESTTKAGINVRKEGPVKENDHGCDAMRYVVAHRDLQFAPRVRWA